MVRRHRVDDAVAKAFGTLANVTLFIVDDMGLRSTSTDAAEGLYRLVDATYSAALSPCRRICTFPA